MKKMGCLIAVAVVVLIVGGGMVSVYNGLVKSQQAVDALFYNAHDFAERYSAQDTLCAQRSAYLSTGAKLISNEGRTMARIVADTCGNHDTSAGCCSCESNAVRFGEATKYQHACRENFIYELGRHGMTKRDIVSNINFT